MSSIFVLKVKGQDLICQQLLDLQNQLRWKHTIIYNMYNCIEISSEVVFQVIGIFFEKY